ncbi:Ig-like domain-containing protein [Sphaerisporangium aureirubrum]|uniref:Ig-like domain-containing protein n=1 Tax=Sphaerisporangium aureirubrum TaxID=1544736 RepID=A0ABW1NE24_9ACTN
MQTGFAATRRQLIPTTITLTASRNPARTGESITFTATVTATGVILATGNVVFRNGSTDIGTAPLEGVAQATFTTSAMAEGTHHITAHYQGNASFDPSTSPIVILKVEALKAKEKEKHEVKEEAPEEEETPVAVHDDDNDDELDRICHKFRNHRGEGGWEDKRWEKLRQHCEDHWHRKDDRVVVIDKGIRRHIYGHYDQGGGHREYWDSHKQRWVPEHRYHKPHHKKIHRHYHKPVQRHFAVTG